MPVPSLALTRWQFDLTWSLFEYHLERLEPEDFGWEPATLCWTMRVGPDGGWVPDWADTEPEPVPVPTIGWLTWHLGWWWSVTLDHLEGLAPRERTDVHWPGPGEPTVTWLRDLRTRWLAVLDRLTDADLARPATFPWQDDPAHTVAHTLGWANAELMKNVAEIGQLRLLRAARAAG
ncbi:DinB superfamily protein [Micromonospora pallida]|uniref:DinB superfamily protein n=1 Tax=Micromonospora pallida TaxID=145854 RepID=A0A1C6T695_9ACTN|nr:DinB family protein [Micromonospora pallida]SCL37187.1 DinB superfamily protein [Micromonospora pallida]